MTQAKQCAHCSKSAGLSCSRYGVGYFCDKACQKAVWSVHRHVCAEDYVERAVHRATWLLQELYIYEREREMTEIIYGIRWEVDRLVVDFSAILGFQNAPLPVTECEEDRRMVLTAEQCRGAVGFYHELFAVLLLGKLLPVDCIVDISY